MINLKKAIAKDTTTSIENVDAMASKKKVRAFKSFWKSIHKWAHPFFDANGRERVLCLWHMEFGMDIVHRKEEALDIELLASHKHALSKPYKSASQRWSLKRLTKMYYPVKSMWSL